MRGSTPLEHSDARDSITHADELELSVILTTYERPPHLERSLASLAAQRNMAGRFEVVVVDDGSKDRTHEVVQRFARTVEFPVKLTTHEHDGFRVASAATTACGRASGKYL